MRKDSSFAYEGQIDCGEGVDFLFLNVNGLTGIDTKTTQNAGQGDTRIQMDFVIIGNALTVFGTVWLGVRDDLGLSVDVRGGCVSEENAFGILRQNVRLFESSVENKFLGRSHTNGTNFACVV